MGIPTIDLDGRVAVVTGGASGIGLGMARAFAAAGMRVVIADIHAEAAEAAAAGLRTAGARAIGVQTDVSKLAEVEALATAAVAEFGAVHVLCNNAGVALQGMLHTVSVAAWEWLLGIDLFGPIYGVKVFQPIIEAQDWGHISSTASVSGIIAGAASGPYNVAKHGVVALMATLERELRARRTNVYASVLCPGPINTGIARNSSSLRPARPPRPVTAEAGSGARLGNKLNDLLAEHGMDPDEVGRIVLQAIRDERFWIFTHPSLNRHAEEQLGMMLDGGMLSRGKLV